MRILHTSDWHLGKRLFKLDRSPEHEEFLNWLIVTLIQEKIDVLLIAGDIFDTPTPPHSSLELFYKFLHRVSVETKTETFIIAGNHDSGLLLEAPSSLLQFHRVKVWGKLSANPADHWIKIQKGSDVLELCALPFFRSYELLPNGEGDALETLSKYLKKERTHPQLLMLHHLAGMYEASGSEQVITLSGVDSIPLELLRTFDYVALGHIHKPQKMGEKIYYSGSPIPMRFSETFAKSVILLTISEGKSEIKQLLIPPSRSLHVVKATPETFKAKIQDLTGNSTFKPMAEVQLTLKEPIIGIIDEIKSELEKKGMELLSYLPIYQQEGSAPKRREKLFELSPVELFEEFYSVKYPESGGVPDELKSDFKELLLKVKHEAP